MPVFVSMGRYTESAIKGLLAKPEDRTAVVKNMVEQAGGKLLAWYMLFGEYDWITVYEMPSGKEAAATMLAVAGAGVVTDMRTMLAMTGAEAKAAFAAGKKLGAACSGLRARAQAPARPGPREPAIPRQQEDQAPLLDADAVPRRKVRQVGHGDLHGAGYVEDRLVAVAEVVCIAHGAET